MQDLGDNIIPCPRELHDKCTREMIYVWEIDAGVIFNPGSGKSLLALILENRRAVAFVKNKAHRDFIMDNLSHEVKVQGLAPDPQPATCAATGRFSATTASHWGIGWIWCQCPGMTALRKLRSQCRAI